jgi:hypothetical protein
MSGTGVFQVLDLDQAFPRAWVDAEGCRAFQFDAFLSHNRDDGSERLLSALSDRGVVAWHDGNADLRDRKVLNAVGRAIDASRTIVLCAGAAFRDSHWIQAEYLPALKVEGNGHLTRVVIAELEPGGGALPGPLRHCPRFACSQTDQLAEFLIGQNRLPSEPGEAATSPASRPRNYQELRSSADPLPPDYIPPADSTTSVLLKVLHESFDEIATHAAGDESYYWLTAPMSWATRDWSSAPPFASVDGALLRELGLRAAASASPDNRAGGVSLLIACDRAWRLPASLADVLDALRNERDSSVIAVAAEWLAEDVDRITRADLALVQLLALRNPALFRATELMPAAERFAAPVRCRVLVDRPLGGLPSGIRLGLLEERLTFILEQTPGVFTTDFGHVGLALRITDTELLVRELCNEVLGVAHSATQRLSPDALADSDLLRRALAIFERIIVHSQTHRGWPLLALGEFAFEFVVHPLCLYHRSPDFWPRSQVLLRAAFGILSLEPRWRAEVPCHRRFIERLTAGWPIDKASKELVMCMLRSAGRTGP